MIALLHYSSHQRQQSSKFSWALLALCSVLSVLVIDSQQKFVSANVISASASEALQHQHQQKMVRKSAGGWVQTYKEPKNDDATAEDGREGQAVAGDEPGDQAEQQQEEEEELSCVIKVHKVEKHSGKCVRLRGGPAACQTDTYLDPTNEDCMFLA